MLIEPDKRGPGYAMPLAYARPDESHFSVPPNLHLIGMMKWLEFGWSSHERPKCVGGHRGR